MFSHVTLGTNDLAHAGRFYDTILLPLGLRRRVVQPDGGPQALCWVGEATLPRFYVYTPFDAQPATAGNGTMVAFLSPSPAAVDQAYESGLALGGTDDGAPGPRPAYGNGYYGAYLRDSDGNKIHLAYRGDLPI